MNVMVTEQVIADFLSLPAELLGEGGDASVRQLIDHAQMLDCWALEICHKQMFHNQLKAGKNPWAKITQITQSGHCSNWMLSFQGQYLLGERQFADDMVHQFVGLCVESGINAFSVSDPLNDPQNLRTSIQSIKAHGMHAQVLIHYTKKPLTYYLSLLTKLEYLNVDSIVVSNESLELMPYQAYSLVQHLKEYSSVPIHLRCGRSKLSLATAIKAIEAGVDGVSTQAMSHLGNQHGVQLHSLADVFAGSNREPSFSKDVYGELEKKVEALELRMVSKEIVFTQIDELKRQTFQTCLKSMQASGSVAQSETVEIEQALAELKKIQTDLSHIPLVEPVLSMLMKQAIVNTQNEIQYQVFDSEFEKLCAGEYGLVSLSSTSLEERIGAVAKQTRSADLLSDELGHQQTSFTAMLNAGDLKPAFLDLEKSPEVFEQFLLSFAMYPELTEQCLSISAELQQEEFEESELVNAEFMIDGENDREMFAGVPLSEDESVVQNYAPDLDLSAQTEEVEFDAATTTGIQVGVAEMSDEDVLDSQDAVNSNSEVLEESFVSVAEVRERREMPSEAFQILYEDFLAPLPGTVLKVLVHEADSVSAGDCLFVMDVMKMQVKIFAEKDAIVVKQKVVENDIVKVDQTLLVLECIQLDKEQLC